MTNIYYILLYLFMSDIIKDHRDNAWGIDQQKRDSLKLILWIGLTTCFLPIQELLWKEKKEQRRPDIIKELFAFKIKPPEIRWEWLMERVNHININSWYKRYIWAENNRSQSWGSLRRQLIDAWNRLNGKDLQMVNKVCMDRWAPFESVFLALVESHWIANCGSPKWACWCWQLMPATARAYGLKVNDRTDERKDKEKSTIAAITYLIDLYQITHKWDRELKHNTTKITESDRWNFAFQSYNCGPKKIIKDRYEIMQWRCIGLGTWFNDEELLNYLPRIHWIRFALYDLIKKWLV